MIAAGTTYRVWCAFINKTTLVGLAGLSPTFDVIDSQTGALLVDGQAYTGAGAKAGLYYYTATAAANIYGGVIVVGHTTSEDAQQKDVFGWPDADFSLTAAILARLDAAITSRADGAVYTSARAGYLDRLNSPISSHSAADVWSYSAGAGRTLTSFGTLVADVAAAVWAYTGARALSTFGTLVADIKAMLLALLSSEATTAGSLAKLAADKLALVGSADVTVIAGGVSVTGDVSIRRGESYLTADANELAWVDTLGSWLDLQAGAGQAIAVTLELSHGETFPCAVTQPTAPNRRVAVDLTAAQTSGLFYGRYAVVARWTRGTVVERERVLANGIWDVLAAEEEAH